MPSGFPVVVASNGRGVPVTQVDGNAPPATVATNGRGAPIVLVEQGGMPLVLFNPDGSPYTGGGVPSLKTQPDSGSANIFYAVRNIAGVGYVTRFIRNTGGSGGTDLGDYWPEWRVGGYGTMASFSGDPETNTDWIATDTGAFDIVANTSALGNGTWYGSYHGLGAGGSLVSETVKIDGVTIDPTSGPLTGETLEVRNETTATNGANVLSRDLTAVVTADGALVYTINALTVTGLNMVYFAMPMASGDDFTEVDIKVATAWNALPLTSGEARAYMVGVNSVRMRNPTTGRFVAVTSDLNSRTGYLRTETLKQLSNVRTKTYLGRFTSNYANLVGAVATVSFGTGATGTVSPGANLMADTTWTAPPWIVVNSNSTQIPSAGVLTQTTATTATTNARYHAPITTVVAGQFYAISSDLLSQAGSVPPALMMSSNSSGSTSAPAPAISQQSAVGRNILVAAATVNAPEQRIMLQHTSATAGNNSVWQNPAAYLVTA